MKKMVKIALLMMALGLYGNLGAAGDDDVFEQPVDNDGQNVEEHEQPVDVGPDHREGYRSREGGDQGNDDGTPIVKPGEVPVAPVDGTVVSSMGDIEQGGQGDLPGTVTRQQAQEVGNNAVNEAGFVPDAAQAPSQPAADPITEAQEGGRDALLKTIEQSISQVETNNSDVMPTIKELIETYNASKENFKVSAFYDEVRNCVHDKEALESAKELAQTQDVSNEQFKNMIKTLEDFYTESLTKLANHIRAVAKGTSITDQIADFLQKNGLNKTSLKKNLDPADYDQYEAIVKNNLKTYVQRYVDELARGKDTSATFQSDLNKALSRAKTLIEKAAKAKAKAEKAAQKAKAKAEKAARAKRLKESKKFKRYENKMINPYMKTQKVSLKDFPSADLQTYNDLMADLDQLRNSYVDGNIKEEREFELSQASIIDKIRKLIERVAEKKAELKNQQIENKNLVDYYRTNTKSVLQVLSKGIEKVKSAKNTIGFERLKEEAQLRLSEADQLLSLSDKEMKGLNRTDIQAIKTQAENLLNAIQLQTLNLKSQLVKSIYTTESTDSSSKPFLDLVEPSSSGISYRRSDESYDLK